MANRRPPRRFHALTQKRPPDVSLGNRRAGQDGPNPSSWARFDVLLNDGELVEIALEKQNGSQVSAGTCSVKKEAVTAEYARAFIAGVPFFNGDVLECADNLD